MVHVCRAQAVAWRFLDCSQTVVSVSGLACTGLAAASLVSMASLHKLDETIESLSDVLRDILIGLKRKQVDVQSTHNLPAVRHYRVGDRC